jgi:hypothetical protein
VEIFARAEKRVEGITMQRHRNVEGWRIEDSSLTLALSLTGEEKNLLSLWERIKVRANEHDHDLGGSHE